VLLLPAGVLGAPRDAPAHAGAVQGGEQAGRPARRGRPPRGRRRRRGPLHVTLPGEEARAARRRRGRSPLGRWLLLGEVVEAGRGGPEGVGVGVAGRVPAQVPDGGPAAQEARRGDDGPAAGAAAGAHGRSCATRSGGEGRRGWVWKWNERGASERERKGRSFLRAAAERGGVEEERKRAGAGGSCFCRSAVSPSCRVAGELSERQPGETRGCAGPARRRTCCLGPRANLLSRDHATGTRADDDVSGGERRWLEAVELAKFLAKRYYSSFVVI
jgi:hypothetical protein